MPLLDTVGELVSTSAANNVSAEGDVAELANLIASALNADLLPATDVSAFRYASIQIITLATGGALTVAGSNDNTTWITQLVFQGLATGTSTPVVGLYRLPINFRYLRIRQTSWTSGSTTGVVELFTLAPAEASGIVAQTGNWTVVNAPTKGIVATYNGANISPSLDTNAFGTLTAHVAKAGAGNVFAVKVTNVGAALAYFQIFNQTTTPVNPNVPLYSVPIAAGTATVPAVLDMLETYFGQGGRNLATGIAWGISSTQATFTDAGTAANYTVHLHFA